MKTITKTLLATAISASVFTTAAIAEESQTFMEALKDGKASVNFRFRVEDVVQDGVEDSTAQTLKTRLTYATGTASGFSGLLEFDQVSELIEVDYATGGGNPNNAGTAVIADPEVTDWNQALVQYKANGVTAKFGRQRILLDNQRFFGGVGWRQNEQTYDAVSASYAGVENLTLTYAHVANVNNIFGNDVNAKDDLLNVKYKFNDSAIITAYGYFLQNEEVDNSDDDTIGANFSGKANVFDYRLELATQETDAYSASYTALNLGAQTGPVKLGFGYEILGADGANGSFQTAYGTKHAFQGWADKFLATPAGGLVDAYFSVGGKMGPVSASIVYHDFESDDDTVGAGDLGSEIDLVVKGKAGPVGLLAKFADYKAGDAGADTKKIWLMATLAI